MGRRRHHDAMPFDAWDEAQVNDAQTLANDRRRRYMEDIRFLLGCDEGRRFFKHLFRRTNILSIYPGQNSGIYFHEGVRNAGKMFWVDVCEAEPHEAAKLQVEMTLEEMQDG